MPKHDDWQVVVVACNWVEEVDCNSGRRRRVYKSGEVQEVNEGKPQLFHVEIELDGVLCAKRCPRYYQDDGFVDRQAIRSYFTELGYQVGQVIRIL